jgi:hypothetical protein
MLCGAADADPPSSAIADPKPYFQRVGGGFACIESKADYELSKVEDREVCLRFGPLFSRMKRSALEGDLGTPVATQKAPDGADAFAYRLAQDSTGLMTTYVVATYAPDERATSLQLTGAPWTGDWRFCGIALGTPQEAVVARLGEPLQRKPSDQPGTVEWSYRPWSFSFEIHDGVVTSIRFGES